MLTYHPAFDIYHTVFRVIKILNLSDTISVERERVRLLDFIMLFPHDLKNVRLPPGYISLKNKYVENPYNKIPNRSRIFYQLEKYFETSVQCLLSYEFLEVDAFKNNILQLTEKGKSNIEILSFNTGFVDENLLQLFKTELFKMSLTELKQRTDLIEFRYDVYTN